VELLAAKEIAARRGISYEVIDMSSVASLLGGSSQTDPNIEVPEGRYDDENMKLTVVPNRNMIMLAIACGHAMVLKYDHVVYGVHSGDHTIYPDCRPDFVNKLNEAVMVADWQKVSLQTPFIDKDKGGCIISALEAIKTSTLKTFPRTTYPQFSQDIGDSWSCYKGGVVHCGKCGACTERQEAFQTAGLVDPTLYVNDVIQD
jgi:7-cyano-7-deazaguanine synthase